MGISVNAENTYIYGNGDQGNKGRKILRTQTLIYTNENIGFIEVSEKLKKTLSFIKY